MWMQHQEIMSAGLSTSIKNQRTRETRLFQSHHPASLPLSGSPNPNKILIIRDRWYGKRSMIRLVNGGREQSRNWAEFWERMVELEDILRGLGITACFQHAMLLKEASRSAETQKSISTRGSNA